MIGKPARNHHWIPQCYLKAFARPASKTGKLWVHDFETSRNFSTIPRNVASARDFNRIDIPGEPIDRLETALSGFEDEVERAIHRTAIASDGFADDDARNLILNLVALLAVRNPRTREQRRQFREDVAKRIMSIILSSRERYESQFRSAKKAGFISGEFIPYEKMKESHDSEEYRVEVDREGQIREEFLVHDDVLQVLGERHWLVIRSSRQIGEFITCDNPVMLRPTNAIAHVQRLGFGNENASVLFPLTKYIFLVGEFIPSAGVLLANRDIVASLNAEIVREADRQVYAGAADFPFNDLETGKLTTGSVLWSISRPTS
jgi:hypothetical protein